MKMDQGKYVNWFVRDVFVFNNTKKNVKNFN